MRVPELSPRARRSNRTNFGIELAVVQSDEPPSDVRRGALPPGAVSLAAAAETIDALFAAAQDRTSSEGRSVVKAGTGSLELFTTQAEGWSKVPPGAHLIVPLSLLRQSSVWWVYARVGGERGAWMSVGSLAELDSSISSGGCVA